jgi:hypothetical protein
MEDYPEVDVVALIALHALASNPNVCTITEPHDSVLVDHAYNLARAFIAKRNLRIAE